MAKSKALITPDKAKAMTTRKLYVAMDQTREENSKIIDQLIAAGLGNIKSQDLCKMAEKNEICARYSKILDAQYYIKTELANRGL